MMAEETVDPGGLTPFDVWLAKHRRGELSDELADRLAEVVSGTLLHGTSKKTGELTLKLTLVKAGASITVVDEIKTKVPEADREMAIYYGNMRGELVRNDPNQGSIFDPDTGEKLTDD